MRCPACATELLHPANFCPVCGARLGSGDEPGTAAAGPLGAPPGEPATVHYLRPGDEQAVGPNPHAADYESPPSGPPIDAPPPLELAGEQWTTNVLGERVRVDAGATTRSPAGERGPTPSEAMFADERRREPRVVGTMVAATAFVLLTVGFGVYAAGMQRGTGGAEAGAFVLLWAVLWVWYVSLPEDQQHPLLMRRHRAFSSWIDRHVDPVRSRTEGRMKLRREKERYRSMRDERTRRVGELGERAYRAFRDGELPEDLHAQARRVLAIEQQMLLQDQRLHELQRPASTSPPGDEAEPTPQ